jgi:predicted PurR-regulated permease PerM
VTDTKIANEKSPADVNSRKLVVFCLLGLVILGLLAVSYRSVLLAWGSAVVFAYLMNPFVALLTRYGLKERSVLLIIFSTTFVTIALTLILGVPFLYQQLTSILSLIPTTTNIIMAKWVPHLESYLGSFGFMTPEEIHQRIVSINFMGRIEAFLQSTATGLWKTSTSVVMVLINLLMIPILTIFLLAADQDLKVALRQLVPLDLRDYVDTSTALIDRALRKAIKGQMIVAAILSILYAIGFSLVGLNLGAVIGVIAGICRFVPYLDVLVGIVLSTIVLVSDFSGGWAQVFMVATVILIVQGLDGALITPAIVGDRIGLHPLVVIMSVIAFGDWFGFVGVILAVPIVAVLKVVVELALEQYRLSPFYRGAQGPK